MTETAPPVVDEWVPCHCCGRTYPAADMVRFHSHPEDGPLLRLRRVALASA
jgi:hypothetical protein